MTLKYTLKLRVKSILKVLIFKWVSVKIFQVTMDKSDLAVVITLKIYMRVFKMNSPRSQNSFRPIKRFFFKLQLAFKNNLFIKMQHKNLK
jgi:hypothetical protein